eukprot:370271_1
MRALQVVFLLASSCLAISDEYIFINGQGQLAYELAKEYCGSLHVDGRLVIITSKEENDEIQRLITGDATTESKWIGFQYDVNEDKYTWVNGDDAKDDVEASWHTYNEFGNEDYKCGAMKEKGGWELRDCISTGKRDFICEIPWYSKDEMIPVLAVSTGLYGLLMAIFIWLKSKFLSIIAYIAGGFSSIGAVIAMVFEKTVIIYVIGGCVIFLTIIICIGVNMWKNRKNKNKLSNTLAGIKMTVLRRK